MRDVVGSKSSTWPVPLHSVSIRRPEVTISPELLGLIDYKLTYSSMCTRKSLPDMSTAKPEFGMQTKLAYQPFTNQWKALPRKVRGQSGKLPRVVLRAPRFSPSLPLLKQLHWLPVNYRIEFKLSTLTYRALAIHQPPYLASLLHFSNIPRQLRSSTSQQLSIPRTKLNLGKRAFSVTAPIIWNELPTTLKSCESLASFRKNLKTYLFKSAFPP